MWGIASVLWGIPSVLWRLFNTVGDNISTVEVFSTLGDKISTCGGITSVHWGDKISTVEGIQYSGGRILISTCLVINNDEKISTFLYYDTKFSFGSFSKIQADFMHFESWTGVLQVQPCFEIIYKFIFGVLYVSFKFNCLCDCTWYL